MYMSCFENTKFSMILSDQTNFPLCQILAVNYVLIFKYCKFNYHGSYSTCQQFDSKMQIHEDFRYRG